MGHFSRAAKIACEKPKTTRPITEQDCKDWAFAIGLLVRNKSPTLESCFRCDSPKKIEDCKAFLAFQTTAPACRPHIGKTVSVAQADCLKAANTADAVAKCKPKDTVFIEMITYGAVQTCL